MHRYKVGDDMDCENVMVFQLPTGHGLLKCAKHGDDYLLISFYSKTYHEPQSKVAAEDEKDAVPVFGVAFSDSRSVDAYIHALTQLSAKMKEDNK